MRGIIIGAGRGERLMPTTAHAPKCFAEVGGRRILDYVLSALRGGGVDPITFIGGYRIAAVREHYPDFDFVENRRWAQTQILASLMCAGDRMSEGFVSSYADIVYRRDAVARLLDSAAPIALMVDTGWRSRYEHRTEHPPTDAEKVTCEAGRITRVHRDIDPALAYGEFTGVAKFTAEGASMLADAYRRATFDHDRAYMIHLLQAMIDDGIEMAHVDTDGDYHEIDTQQDLGLATAAHAAGERWG